MFTGVGAAGVEELIALAQTRAAADPTPYAHWYVDGGRPVPHTQPDGNGRGLIGISYDSLAPVRAALLERMRHASASGNVGPESLRSLLAQLRPADFGLPQDAGDEILHRFELSLLTEGSGTQIFSTTFVQWTGREILRRARPRTLVLRYAPRQVDRPMNDLLFAGAGSPAEDPEGSLVDANMGAFYTWLNLSRLPGAPSARFLAWFEGGAQAVAIAPGMAKGSSSSQPCSLGQIVQWMA